MRAFSAADSVSLAVQRTRDFLFKPFRWGTYLKLGLVAIITEGVGSNLRSSSSSRGGHPSGRGSNLHLPFALTPERIAMAVAALLLVLVISLALFYLVTRLRFAFFHCLTHNTREIRPGWHIYREPAARFFWLNVGVGFCFLLVVVLVAIPFAAGFWRLFHEYQLTGHPDIGLMLSLLLPLIPIIVVLGVAGILADVFLRDWMMPHFAIDNATAGEAWRSVWASITAEKRQFAAYVLLRLVLPTLAMLALFMVLILPGLALAGAVGAIEYGVHSAFADATGGARVTGILLQVFFGVVAAAFLLLASVCLGGPLSTGIREYALTFYGGRYPPLGNLLYPPVPPSPEARPPKFA